jgi:hypothetical protein
LRRDAESGNSSRNGAKTQRSESFAKVHLSEFDSMVLRATGQKFPTVDTIYPNVSDGVEGMYFIQQCVKSSAENGAWVPLRHRRARK